MKLYYSVTLLVIQLLALTIVQQSDAKDYCVYGDSCWPSDEAFELLQAQNPDMTIVRIGENGYKETKDLVLNRRIAKNPGATAYASTLEHIVAIVDFTRNYSLDLKIVSSGHEFIGRNTAQGCLLLSVAKMVASEVNLNCPQNSAGCYTAEPGVWWLQAYREVDAVGRTILGGAEPSVSVTGWSLGGGHSPFSPKIGLGADQIVGVSMVLADSSQVTLSKDNSIRRYPNGTVTFTEETDLFWAVRGGGGGTFGVVTSITFRLHMPPSKFTTWTCEFGAVSQPKKAMKEIKLGMRDIIEGLPDEFGGYQLTGTLCYTLYPTCKMAAYSTYALTHYGAKSDNAAAFARLDAEADALSEYLLSGDCKTVEYDSFYEWVLTLPNVTHQTVDMDGTFISSTEYSDKFIKKEASIIASSFNSKKPFAATWIRLGGQTRNDSSGATAINPLFRNAMWTVAYGGDENHVKKFDKLVDKTVETKGQYFSECDDDLPYGEWQSQFWGDSTYTKLVAAKDKYDPNYLFMCKQCVGSESLANHPSASIAATLLIVFVQLLSLM